MKQLFYFLCLASAVFTSCSGDDDLTPYDPNADQGAIVQGIVETFDDNTTVTTNFRYEGNKIINFINSEGASGVFTYSGNNITKVAYFEGVDLVETNVFTYNAANQILSFKTISEGDNFATRDDFTYNSDGTVSVASYFGTPTEQTTPTDASKWYYAGGELVKKETFSLPNTITETFTYDTKNNPFKNIIGLNEVFVAQGNTDGLKKNLLTSSGTSNPHDITYVYNSAGFPESSVENSALDGGFSTQYFYE